MYKSIISISQLTKEGIMHVLHHAQNLKKTPQPELLKGHIMASCFFEPSTRTRLSFETAMERLGGQVMGFADAGVTSAKKKESLYDSMKIIGQYADVIAMRHPLEGAARRAAEATDKPILNGGDGANQHPTQTLLDLFSILETQGTLENLHIAVVGDLKYGRHLYDYQAGTLAFFAPGQVMEMQKPPAPYQPMGFGLVFHPDFLLGTTLGKRIDEYQFFDYETHEALHLSEDERSMILSSFQKIQFELNQPIDKHSKKLIAANIELFLDYCQRFYDRQFITRDNINKGLLAKFEQLLKDYFNSEQPHQIGIPAVSYFAQQLNLSANYFGDLIKKETGQSAKDYLQNKTIETAKKKMVETDKNINEISIELGFKYPQHFTRLFKQKVGITPNEYRNLN